MSEHYPHYQQQQPPPTPPRKRRAWPWVLLSVSVVMIVMFGGCIALVGTAVDDVSEPTTSATDKPAKPAGDEPTTVEPSEEQTTQAAKKHKVLKVDGAGIKTTRKFDVTADQAKVRYRFDCSSFGYEGNFQIYLHDGDGVLVDILTNELATKGKGSTFIVGAGTYRLKMNSQCDWNVKVVERR